MKRSLIIDGQMLQTDAWHRGMGRYLLQVLSELSDKHAAETEVALLLNDQLPLDAARLEELNYLAPNVTIVRCDLPLPNRNKLHDNGAKLYKKRLNLQTDKLFPDSEKSYLLTSLFLFDFFAYFPDNCHKLLLFYDLTPMLFWQDLGGYFPKELYMKRFSRLYEAEQIFAISETTRQDLLGVFGLNPRRITNINGGFIKIAERPIKPKGFAIPTKFILFPTGNLPHKNNELTVKAFSQYCKQRNSSTKLLITSHFSDQAKQHLLSLSEHIVFTDNVTGDELEWLYENAEAILFSSKYEGLGMPILDAVANKKPIIASRIPVFEEMSRTAFYFFDPENSDELEERIEQALARQGLREKLQHYPAIMGKYTWTKTTKGIHAFVKEAAPQSVGASAQAQLRRPRVAVCSLHPGIKGQIGRLSEQLYASLKDSLQLDYYFDSNGLNFRELDRPTFLDSMGCRVFDITQLGLRSYPKYDKVVYLIDQFAIPSRLAQRAVVLPGLLISGSFANLGEQGKLLKQLIIENLDYNYNYQAKGFEENQAIAAYISAKGKQP